MFERKSTWFIEVCIKTPFHNAYANKWTMQPFLCKEHNNAHQIRGNQFLEHIWFEQATYEPTSYLCKEQINAHHICGN